MTAPTPDRQVFGLAHEMGMIVLPYELARMYHDELGVRELRYMVQRPHIEPERGKFDWSFVDETIANAQKAGLHVTFNAYFYNPWMTSGLPLLTGYDCDCTKGADPRSREDAPQCYDPKLINEIDSEAIQEQAAIVAQHLYLEHRIDTFGIENEPGVRDYFLTAFDEDAGQAIDRWFLAIARPFIHGVRSVIPGAKFVTQFDAFCNYARCLEIEAQFLGRTGRMEAPPREIVPLFDTIGIHPYATATEIPGIDIPTEVAPKVSVSRSTDAVIAKTRDEFQSRMSPWLAGRSLAVAEIQGVDNIRLMRELKMDVTEHNPARYVTMHQEWRRTGPVLVPGLPGGPKTFEFTAEGRAFAAAMREYDPALFTVPVVDPPAPKIPPHQRPTRRK